ncbi:MAG: ketopantoate reductase family protein, partial [Asgard group archaeon]|nr:ketopantoate reductase family protein [Asgard group archaeon]
MLKKLKKESFHLKSIPMRDDILFLVIGAGSVGSLFGGLLANIGQDVLLIGRKMHIEAIKRNKLIIKGLHNLVIPILAVDNINSARFLLEEHSNHPRFVLVTTKAHQTAEAVEQLREIVTDQTIFLSIQNGIGTEDIIHSKYPENTVLRGITSIGVSCPEPGIIDFSGEGQTFIGCLNEKGLDYAKEVVELLKETKVNSLFEPNILGAVFSKTIVNCGLNPLTALYKVKNIDILNKKNLREKAIALAQEAWNVSKKMGIDLLVKNPIDFMI